MHSRQFAPAAYLVGLSLGVIPMFDALMQVAPFHPMNAQWRFGAVGLVSNALMLPAIGVLIASVAAAESENRVAQRLLRILSWAAAAIALTAAVMFLLDAVQTRAAVRPALQTSFLVASATALFKLVFGALVFGMLGRGGHATSARSASRGARPSPPPIIAQRESAVA